MKTKMTPIVSWSLWAGGLSLVMGIVTRHHLVAGFASDETGMSYVITALFAAGLVISFLSAKSLHNEWGVLAAITKSNKIPKSGKKNDLAGVFGKLEGFKDKGESVDVHTAIDTYHSKHNSRVRSVSIMAALVISMGLLGTVVGLIMSISGLGFMVENIGLSRTTMMEALKATVSGMGTAFYTTFFGALGGLILRAVAVSQLNSLSELCSEAAEYASKNLTATKDQDEGVNQQLSKVIESFENMQHEVDALTVRIADSIQATLGKFGESIEAVGEHAKEATKDAVSGMTEQLGEFGTTVQDSFGQFNEMVVKSGQDVEGSIALINENITHASDDIEESFESLNGNISSAGEKMTEKFDGLGNSVDQAGEAVSGSLAEFKLAIDGTAIQLNEAVGHLHAAIMEANGEMDSMNKAKLNAEASQIAGHLSVAADSIQQFLQREPAKEDSDADESQKVA